MVAKITAVLDDQTDAGFESIINSAERTERQLSETEREAADLRKELESRAADAYRRRIKELADQFSETKGEADGLRGSLDRMVDAGSGAAGRITAVATSATAVMEGFRKMAEVAREAWEVIQEGAALGDVNLQQLEASINRVSSSWDDFKLNLARGAANDLPWLDDFADWVAGMSSETAAWNKNLDQRLKLLENIDTQMQDQARQEAIAHETNVKAIEERIAQLRLELSSVKQRVVSEKEMAELGKELIALEQRRKRVIDERATAERKAIEDRQRLEAERIRELMAEEQRRFKAWEADHERMAREEAKRMEELAKADAERLKAQQRAADEHRQRELDQWKEHIDKLKAAFTAQEDGQRSTVQRLVGGQSQREVFDTIVRRRQQEAERERGEPLDRRAQRELFKDTFRDMRAGRIDSSEVIAAQNANAQQQIRAAHASGRLGRDTARALAMATEELAKQEQEQEMIRQQVERITDVLTQTSQRGERSRSQRRGLRG